MLPHPMRALQPAEVLKLTMTIGQRLSYRVVMGRPYVYVLDAPGRALEHSVDE